MRGRGAVTHPSTGLCCTITTDPLFLDLSTSHPRLGASKSSSHQYLTAGPPPNTKTVQEVAAEAGHGLAHLASSTGSSVKKLTKASVSSVKSLGSRQAGARSLCACPA